jgi:hypothetical protein
VFFFCIEQPSLARKGLGRRNKILGKKKKSSHRLSTIFVLSFILISLADLYKACTRNGVLVFVLVLVLHKLSPA